MQKIETLKLNKEFKRVYYQGKYKASPFIVTYMLKTRTQKVRYGITTSKKIGCAVIRNRCRRIIRAAFLEIIKEKDKLNGYDFVFVARKDTINKKSNEIKKIIEKQIEDISVR